MSGAGALDWPLLPRQGLVQTAATALAAGSAVGVLLTGETGAGKTTTALELARALSSPPTSPTPPTPPTSPRDVTFGASHERVERRVTSRGQGEEGEGFVRLRGSALASAMPYGLLFGLRPESGGDSYADAAAFRALLVEAVARRTQPGGRAVVLVDNAGLCDPLSAHALAQLAAEGAVRLVLATAELGDLPEAFLELWRDGLLPVVPVPPLSPAEVGAVLEGSLHAPVVAAAAGYLAERSGGNPLFLNYLVIEQLEAGLLVQKEGRWILAGPASLSSDRLVGMLKTRVDQWSPAQREVLEIVALMETIGLDRLEALADPEPIAELLDTGILELVDRERLLLRIANSLVAEVVRASVPFLRRRALRTRVAPFVADAAELATDDPRSALAFSAWTLECGAPLEPELAVHAARLANRLFDPEFAIRVASTVKAGPLLAEAAVQKSRALRTLGRPANAGQVLRKVLPAVQGDERLELVVEVVLEVARVEGALPGFGEFAALRRETAERIAARRHGDEAERLHQGLELAEWALLLRSGEYPAALGALTAAVQRYAAGGTVLDTEYAVRCVSMLAECLCAVGRQEEALGLADGLARAAGDDAAVVLGDDALDEVREALALVYLRTGRWQARRELIRNPGRGVLGRELYRGSGDDGALGIGHLFGGSSRLGREHLMSALSQIRLRDVDNGRGEILAALAYSSALDGDLELARGYLDESRSGSYSNWSTGASATYLALNAEALLEAGSAAAAGLDSGSVSGSGSGDAIERMLATAAEYRDRGLAADALLLTSAAARLGSAEALDLLAVKADRMPQPGPLARAVYTWVDAVRAGDPALLLDAAEALMAEGNELFAREIAVRVRESAPPTLVGRAAAVVRQADEVLGVRAATDATASRFDALTKRERDVAALVAEGLANRDIAAALHLSVRTVESYLQSAFGKLGVANRRELAQLSAAAG
ncbi:MAG: LuxR C-terminal-related transcriptional regulator [Herbiconiux sp.]|nr:LuxR C-terminal-related transcriptional regulator [Herbiconiux sp.]